MWKFKLWVGNITTQADNNCIFNGPGLDDGLRNTTSILQNTA